MYMKKIIYRLSIILLSIFSFYYTNKTIEFLKDKDPIMQEIKNTKDKYTIKYLDATIIGNNIISGKNGKTINYTESYNKMKKYGTYNETLTVLKETTPKISINNNYDKYIIKGNSENKKVKSNLFTFYFRCRTLTDLSTPHGARILPLRGRC